MKYSKSVDTTAPKDMRTKLTRRALIGGMSSLAVALTRPIWQPVTAFGQDAQASGAKRFMAFFQSNGIVPARFWPNANGVDSPLVLTEPLSPLADHQDRLLLLKGIHMYSTIEDNLGQGDGSKPGGPHMKGPGAMLTGGSLTEGDFTGAGGPAGYADRISVDQYLAQTIGQVTKFPSIEFGVRMQGQEPLRYISYSGPSMPVTPVDDPWRIYDRVFSDLEAGTDDGAAERALADKRSVLDFIKGDLSRLSSRVNSSDKARLDAHLEHIRGLERQILAAPVSCEPPMMPERIDPVAMSNFDVISRIQLDLMLLAHICDLTRVSSFMFANANSWQHFPWLGIDEEHHEMSHASDDDAVQNDKLVRIHAWHSEQFAYVLDRLAEVSESDGTSLLDSSFLLWGNELGAGNTHSYRDVPWLLAGGGGGTLRGGRLLQYQDTPHNNLLVSVCQAMGLTEVTSFGIPGVCTGSLRGLAG
jgi:hypothetical protein